MIYRRRTYRVNPDGAERFTRFFIRYLLPNQQKHGARLTGWINESGTEITAVYE